MPRFTAVRLPFVSAPRVLRWLLVLAVLGSLAPVPRLPSTAGRAEAANEGWAGTVSVLHTQMANSTQAGTLNIAYQTTWTITPSGHATWTATYKHSAVSGNCVVGMEGSGSGDGGEFRFAFLGFDPFDGRAPQPLPYAMSVHAQGPDFPVSTSHRCGAGSTTTGVIRQTPLWVSLQHDHGGTALPSAEQVSGTHTRQIHDGYTVVTTWDLRRGALDSDADGLTDQHERAVGTDPSNRDTDGDRLPDGAEVNVHRTSPLLADTDGDGVADGDEIAQMRDPRVGGQGEEAPPTSTDDPRVGEMLASLGLDLVPVVNVGKGIVEAAIGQDAVTGEKLAWWERGLGIIPYVKLLRKAEDLEDVGGLGRGCARSISLSPAAPAQEDCASGTVWDSMKGTQPVYPGTVIPRSFEMAADTGRYWVHPNATEHLLEYADRAAVQHSHGALLVQQALLDSLQASLAAAEKRGIQWGQPMRVGPWALIFEAESTTAGTLAVLKHAQPIGL